MLIVIVVAVLAYVIISRTDSTPPATPPVSEEISGNTADLVSISILPGQDLQSGAVVTGIIKGGYFFEANARGALLDASKATLKTFSITATGDWMTADPVAFSASVDTSGIPAGTHGYFRIMNDNPSGDSANDKHVDVPVVFQ